MDTEEMYRRGVADAEHSEPQPFYYQHYYQYRRGYDRTRRRLGLPGGFYDIRRRRLMRLGLAALILLVAVAAVLVWRGNVRLSTARTPALQPTGLSATPGPTRTPIFASPTPPPTEAPPALRVGASARVANTQGAVLRGRKQPSVGAPVTVNFKEGEQVRLLEGPVDADGFTWWRIEGKSGAAWSAQQSKDGSVWLLPGEAQ